MTCKHCNEEIKRPTSRCRIKPYTKRDWWHAQTHLYSCFNGDDVQETQAEPESR